MANLHRSTALADSTRETCTCVREHDGCAQHGRWHAHDTDPCPVHPSNLCP